MNSKEKIKNIKSVINEFYHKEKCEGRLTECANDCWKSYQKDCDEIEQDLDRLKRLEKELKQTKLNFRNSQTHSKNCYKKLKEKYNEVEYCYEKLSKDHMSLKKSFDELFEISIIKTHDLLQLGKENKELKEAIKILKAKLVPILLLQEVDTLEEYNEGLDDCDEYRLTQEEFDLLKKVFESVGEE